jgi:hypothetical protein
MQKVYQINISGIIVTDDSEGNPENWGVEDLIESLAGYPDVEVHEMALVRRVEEPVVEVSPEPELKTGPDTGSNIKTRENRWRSQRGCLDKEYRYEGKAYIRHAKLLGLGTTKAKTREVWLTEEEIPTVREAVYAARMAKGLRTGIPRNRLVLVGGE